MNSTVLALLLLTSLNTLPERPTATSAEPPTVTAVSPFQPSDQASRLAAKGRLPQDRLKLRLEPRLALATTAP